MATSVNVTPTTCRDNTAQRRTVERIGKFIKLVLSNICFLITSFVSGLAALAGKR